MPDLPKIWPTDRISDDHTVSDAIHNAVLAERKRLTKEHLSAIAFDAGKSYLVFVSREHVPMEAIAQICEMPVERDYAQTFVFVDIPRDGSVRDVVTSVEVKPDSIVFVSEDALPEDLKIEGVRFISVRVPPGRELRDLLAHRDMSAEEQKEWEDLSRRFKDAQISAGVFHEDLEKWLPTIGEYTPLMEMQHNNAAVQGERLRERDRCAKIAETWESWCGRTGYGAEEYAAEDIAAKIRSGA